MHLTHSNLSFGTDINDINLVDDLNVFISSEPFLTVIIAVYSVIVVCGRRKENIPRFQLNTFLSVLGNLAVMLTVVFTKEIRTARNVFIFSLALSDFLLALTIPATVYDAVTTSWQMSTNVNLCRSENRTDKERPHILSRVTVDRGYNPVEYLTQYQYCLVISLYKGEIARIEIYYFGK